MTDALAFEQRLRLLGFSLMALPQLAPQLPGHPQEEDAARGVIWPKIDPQHYAACGHDWHLFPNTVILPGRTFALCYRARPNGYDPNSCIFEVYVLERFPDGQEPKTEWVFAPDPTEEQWRLILSQDFGNMPYVQKGMKSRGFPGPRPGKRALRRRSCPGWGSNPHVPKDLAV